MADAQIQRMSQPDRFGERQEEGAPIDTRMMTSYPRMSDESTEGALVVGINVLLEPGAPMPRSQDDMIIRGRRWSVIGEPGDWYWLDGSAAAVEVTLTAWKG